MTDYSDNDVKGECNARLFIGADHGEDTATFRCGLHAGHGGLHSAMYDANAGCDFPSSMVSIKWVLDETIVCPAHGRVDRNWHKDQEDCDECQREREEAEHEDPEVLV